MDDVKIYEELAKRNGWSFSMIDDRPYFMKNGSYAIPDEHTSQEDKDLLATIISEGSEYLKKIILTCWENNIIIAGPCSGIREFHTQEPSCLHFGIKAPFEISDTFYQRIMPLLPNCNHYIREDRGLYKYDLNYALKMNGITLSKEQSEEIFKVILEELTDTLGIQDHRM